MHADKAKAAQAAAEKLATDKRKVANDSKTKRDKLNKDQAAAKKTLDATAKKVTTAETEYKKLEDPRVQAVNEFNLATKAKTKADGIQKEADTAKKAADELAAAEAARPSEGRGTRIPCISCEIVNWPNGDR